MAQVFCEQCGVRLRSQSIKFCEQCGAAVSVSSLETGTADPSVTAEAPAVGLPTHAEFTHTEGTSMSPPSVPTDDDLPSRGDRADDLASSVETAEGMDQVSLSAARVEAFDDMETLGVDELLAPAPKRDLQPEPAHRRGRIVAGVAAVTALTVGIGFLVLNRMNDEVPTTTSPTPAAPPAGDPVTEPGPASPTSMRLVKRAALGKATQKSRPGVMLLSGSQLVVTHPFNNELTVLDVDDRLKKRTVRSTGGPWALTRGPSLDLVYAANHKSGTVSAFNLTTGRRVKTAAVGSKPIWLGVTPDQRSLYVINSGSGSLSVVDVNSFRQTARVALGGYGFNVGFDGEEEAAFVPMATNDRLARIDMVGPELAGAPTVGDVPTDVAVSGNRAYVTLLKGKHVIAVDTISGSVDQRVRVGKGASRIVLSPDGKQALVIRSRAGQIVVLDLENLDVLGRVDVESPLDAAYTPDGSAAVVAAQSQRGMAWLIGTTDKPAVNDRLRLGGTIIDVTVTQDGSTAFLLDNKRNLVAQVAIESTPS